jgi:hypothetical protein
VKTLVVPPPLKCPITIAPAGKIDLGAFIRELVFPRPAWRERGKAALLLEIDAVLDAPPGTDVKWSDEAHELLCQEVAMRDIQIRWDLAPVLAQFQEILFGAKASAEN